MDTILPMKTCAGSLPCEFNQTLLAPIITALLAEKGCHWAGRPTLSYPSTVMDKKA